MLKNDYYKKWVKEGKPIPPPSIIKYIIVLEYAKAFDIKILIETGTFKGGLANYTKDYFKQIYTIELDSELYRKAKDKFSDDKNIKVLKGDSSELLPEILGNISEPSIFWLDSHYSGGVTAVGNKFTPIVEELKHIFTHPIQNHVILIDDARCFGIKKDYPPVNVIEEMLLNNYPDFMFEIKDDIIFAHPLNSNSIII